MASYRIKGKLCTPRQAISLFNLGNPHNTCIIFKYEDESEYEKKYLFPGDASIKAFNRIINNGGCLKSEILKQPHHGSKNNFSKKILNSISPDISVVSYGVPNKYRHPHPAVIGLLNQNNVRIYHTLNGTINL